MYPVAVLCSLCFILFCLGDTASGGAIIQTVSPSNIPFARSVTSGNYVDSSGKAHSWQITDQHDLIWENSAYFPVGVRYIPISWIKTDNSKNDAADDLYFTQLKNSGINDICLCAPAGGLMSVPAMTVQRTISYLESIGLCYGIDIADYPKDPLVGFVIKPGIYRYPASSANRAAKFSHISGLSDAIYMYVSTHDGEVDESGHAKLIDEDTAEVEPKELQPDDVLLLYPQQIFVEGAAESQMPDIWGGYDDYRDRLLTYLRRLQFGPRFRFYLDPLGERITNQGAISDVVPSSAGFRMDFEAWLGQHYNHNLDDLNRAWGIADRSSENSLPSFSVASRCFPLWLGTRGVPAIYDPVTETRYVVNNRPSIQGHTWQDFNDFRLESSSHYMSAIANVLRKGVADVPVLYAWSSRSALFSEQSRSDDLNGLALESLMGQSSVVSAAAALFGHAEDSSATTWLLACESLPGDADLNGFLESSGEISDLGVRGLYIDDNIGRNVSEDDEFSLINSVAHRLNSGTQGSAKVSRILWYPENAGLDIGIRHLDDGTWWLPTTRRGEEMDFGIAVSGYYIEGRQSQGTEYVLWSTDGNKLSTQFALSHDSPISVTTPAGNPIHVDIKSDVLTIPIGPDPVIIHNAIDLQLPIDAVEKAHSEAVRLIGIADSQHLEIQQLKDQVFYATYSIPDSANDQDLRYGLYKRIIESLKDKLRPFTWIEGEDTDQQNFDSVASDASASNGAYLLLDTNQNPDITEGTASTGYNASYTFSVNRAGRYTVWMGGSQLSNDLFSPFTYSVDDQAPIPIDSAPAIGDTYSNNFAWSNLGEITLDHPGKHHLSIVVTGRRSTDNRYALAIDAFCIDRDPFAPNGAHKPIISTARR